MSRFFIGIEGGATKTEGILIDDSGKIYVTLQAGPSNPWVNKVLFFLFFMKEYNNNKLFTLLLVCPQFTHY